MADLVVDIDGLESLMATVRRIQKGLNETKTVVERNAWAIGSGEVVAAMDHFQSHWKDGRKHINENADTMSSMLTDSVAAYRKTDEELATSVQTHETETRIGGGG